MINSQVVFWPRCYLHGLLESFEKGIIPQDANIYMPLLLQETAFAALVCFFMQHLHFCQWSL